MQGIFNWVKGKFNSAYETVSSAVATTGQVLTAVGSIFTSPSVRQGISDYLIQFWQGFSRIADPAVPISTVATRPQTIRMYARGQAGTLLRMGTVIGYRWLARPMLETGLEAYAPNARNATMLAVDAAAYLYFIRNAINGVIDNAAYTAALGQAASKESKVGPRLKNQPRNALAHECGDDVVDQVTASIPAAINYYGDKAWLEVARRTIPYGEYVTGPIRAAYHGRALLQYPLAAAGNCEKHRLEALNANTPYALGLGSSLLLAQRVLEGLIASYTGVDSVFVTSELWNLLWMHFTLVTTAGRGSTPLPGTQPGMDPFYLTRALTGKTLEVTAEFVKEQLNKPGPAIDWKAVLDMPPAKFVRLVFIDKTLQDWEELAYRPSSRAYLETHGEGLQKAMEWLKTNREQYKNVHFYSKRAPQFLVSWVISKEQQDGLDTIMDEKLEPVITVWYPWLLKIRKDREIPKIEVIDEEEEKAKQDLYSVPNGRSVNRRRAHLKMRNSAERFDAVQDWKMQAVNRPPAIKSAPVKVMRDKKDEEEKAVVVRKPHVEGVKSAPRAFSMGKSPSNSIYGMYRPGVNRRRERPGEQGLNQNSNQLK